MINNLHRLLILSSLLIACSPKPPEEIINSTVVDETIVKIDSVDMLRQAFRNIDLCYSVEDKTYIIIPSDGCSVCMEPAIDFLKKNIDQPNYAFVITEIPKSEVWKEKFGLSVIESNSLILDTGNYIGLAGFYSIYPQVISIKRQKLDFHKHLDYTHINFWEKL